MINVERPAFFQWSEECNFTEDNWNLPAKEWQRFCESINEIRHWKELPMWYFEEVEKEQKISTDIFNEPILAMKDMLSCDFIMPPDGGKIGKHAGKYFVLLQDLLNSIR